MSSSQIPLFSAAVVNARLDFLSAITSVLDSHWYVLGNEVKLFEEEFAKYVDVTHCISVANGSDALELALKGLGVERGDHVVAVANAGFTAAQRFMRSAQSLCTWTSPRPA